MLHHTMLSQSVHIIPLFKISEWLQISFGQQLKSWRCLKKRQNSSEQAVLRLLPVPTALHQAISCSLLCTTPSQTSPGFNLLSSFTWNILPLVATQLDTGIFWPLLKDQLIRGSFPEHLQETATSHMALLFQPTYHVAGVWLAIFRQWISPALHLMEKSSWLLVGSR